MYGVHAGYRGIRAVRLSVVLEIFLQQQVGVVVPSHTDGRVSACDVRDVHTEIKHEKCIMKWNKNTCRTGFRTF